MISETTALPIAAIEAAEPIWTASGLFRFVLYEMLLNRW